MNRIIVCCLAAALLFACGDGADTGRIEGTGTIEGIQVNLASRVAGPVAALHAREGGAVNTGKLLVQIDDEDYRLQAAVAEHGMNAAQAKLDLLTAGARKEDVDQGRENVNAAAAALGKAQAYFGRINDLRKKNSATQAAFDDAKAAFDIATAQHAAARKTLEKLLNGARIEEVNAARAQREQAAANLNLLNKKVEDCSIRSPIAGIVTNKLVEAGEWVNPGGGVMTVTKTDSMWLSIYIKETDLGNVVVGQRTEISVDSHPDRVFTGTVGFIAEEAEFTPKNIQTKDERVKLVYKVKILIRNEDGILKAGMPADAEIIIR